MLEHRRFWFTDANRKSLFRNNSLLSRAWLQTRQRMRIDYDAEIVTSGWIPWTKNVCVELSTSDIELEWLCFSFDLEILYLNLVRTQAHLVRGAEIARCLTLSGYLDSHPKSRLVFAPNLFTPKFKKYILPTLQRGKCISEWVRGQVQVLYTVWCNILVRLQEKVDIDHYWEWKGKFKNVHSPNLLKRSV